MSKKQESIIIDGVNVAECQCFENDKCLWCKKYHESNVTPNCKEVKDCYFKQIQRLKQENEELKKKINTYVCSTSCHKYIQADKYKNALEEIREHCKTFINPKHRREYDEVFGGYLHYNILELCNEVLNEK